MKPLAVAAWSMITPLGEDDATINALFEQRSAFSPQKSHWKVRNNLAAVVPERPSQAARDGDWQRYLATYVIRKVLNTLSIDIQNKRDRCAFVFATSYGHLIDDAVDDTMSTWAKDCVRSLQCDIDPIVVGSGCSSGSDALGIAAAMLDYGTIDTAIVVAVDIVTDAKRIAHSTLGTMAASDHKPFDINRSGMLLGEASAAVVLMRSEDCPEHRGKLVGIGASNDAFGLTAPDPSGLSVRLALDRALLAAELTYNDLALYLAHGTGTQLNDDLEAKVVEEVFANNEMLTIVGTKGALGHSLGACGVVEFILLLQMLNRQLAPATVGLTDPIRSISARFPGPEGRPLSGPYGVSVTLGFGGFNTALIARA
ncbi:MAG TPA: beta-ketoacyl synthase N-terminal-like domain-containing protein [Bryobacteraceae bacterium]|jgi:3-oxoacyl-[acyl-carrier-protein] synthase II|nr:beta-ketoacyl synthase N-terminal-like domain-containing protein [Bryobacteraceae bacterium]